MKTIITDALYSNFSLITELNTLRQTTIHSHEEITQAIYTAKNLNNFCIDWLNLYRQCPHYIDLLTLDFYTIKASLQASLLKIDTSQIPNAAQTTQVTQAILNTPVFTGSGTISSTITFPK